MSIEIWKPRSIAAAKTHDLEWSSGRKRGMPISLPGTISNPAEEIRMFRIHSGPGGKSLLVPNGTEVIPVGMLPGAMLWPGELEHAFEGKPDSLRARGRGPLVISHTRVGPVLK